MTSTREARHLISQNFACFKPQIGQEKKWTAVHISAIIEMWYNKWNLHQKFLVETLVAYLGLELVIFAQTCTFPICSTNK